jgi:hypothetical protein
MQTSVVVQGTLKQIARQKQTKVAFGALSVVLTARGASVSTHPLIRLPHLHLRQLLHQPLLLLLLLLLLRWIPFQMVGRWSLRIGTAEDLAPHQTSTVQAPPTMRSVLKLVAQKGTSLLDFGTIQASVRTSAGATTHVMLVG